MGADMQGVVDMIGAVLDGRYRIEKMLGEGGMGAVYSATDLRLEKRVAVKVMARELSANPDALARFHREARVTSGLGHPHIVQVFDFSTTPSGEPFLVMEFLEGEDLEQRIRRHGRLPAATVVHVVKQVASALSATHAKGIVHRDLKPGNIYLLEALGETDFVKVLDFGISKVRTASTKLTKTSSIMGTPNYMSPEQAKGKIEEIDERTDQWALACIAWECLSGEGPFVGENVPSILFQIVHEPPEPLPPKVTGLAAKVEETLLHALAKDKRQRFASVTDFAQALEDATASTSSVASPSVQRTALLSDVVADGVPSKKSVPWTTFTQTAGELDETHDVPRSKKWFWALATGVAILVLFGAILVFGPGPAPRPVVASPQPAPPSVAVAIPVLASPGSHCELGPHVLRQSRLGSEEMSMESASDVSSRHSAFRRLGLDAIYASGQVQPVECTRRRQRGNLVSMRSIPAARYNRWSARGAGNAATWSRCDLYQRPGTISGVHEALVVKPKAIDRQLAHPFC
jgi:serine/threonine-protein kinase